MSATFIGGQESVGTLRWRSCRSTDGRSTRLRSSQAASWTAAKRQDPRPHTWSRLCSIEAEAGGFESGFDARNASDRHVAEAIQAALEASQPHHIIDVRTDGWAIQHSMACRLSGRLFECATNQAALRMAGPPGVPGWYVCESTEYGRLVLVGEPATGAGGRRG